MKKKYRINLLRAIAGIILGFSLISKWLKLDINADKVSVALMFSTIGIIYILIAIKWDTIWFKILLTVCGAYLIAVNFLTDHTALSLLAAACLLTPMLIIRFSKDDSDYEELNSRTS